MKKIFILMLTLLLCLGGSETMAKKHGRKAYRTHKIYKKSKRKSKMRQRGVALSAGLNYQNYNDATWNTLRLIRNTSYVNRMTPEMRAMLSGKVAVPEAPEGSTPFLESQYDNPNTYYNPSVSAEHFYADVEEQRQEKENKTLSLIVFGGLIVMVIVGGIKIISEL